LINGRKEHIPGIGTHSQVAHSPGPRAGMTVGVWVAIQKVSPQGSAGHDTWGAAETWRATEATKATRRVRKAIVVMMWGV
jgi:hypothetical protein